MNLNWPLECKFVICLLKKIVSQLSKFMKRMTSLVVQWIRICLPLQGVHGFNIPG